MEGLGFLQEPFKPATFPIHLFELIEAIAFIYPRVESKLSTLDEPKDDGVLKPGEDQPDILEREWVFVQSIVGLHLQHVSGDEPVLSANFGGCGRKTSKSLGGIRRVCEGLILCTPAGENAGYD